jgi:hypothetical protein
LLYAQVRRLFGCFTQHCSQTRPMPISPNGIWPWTHYVTWSPYKPLCPAHVCSDH